MIRTGRYSVPLALALMASASLTVAADKLDGNDKKWLAQVSALIQSDEQGVFRSIPKSDRPEFQVIFWARRNPQGPSAPKNEFKERFLRSVEEADKKFAVPGTSGASTGCGRIYLLLGPPDQVSTAEAQVAQSVEAIGMLGRKPETWMYKDRPGLTFSGGHASITFDGRCDFPRGGSLEQQLAQLATDRIITPDIKPEAGADGRLTSLVELLKRRRTPAQMLFISPRQDFPFEHQHKLSMRVPLGTKVGTYVAGLLRVPVAGLTVIGEGGKKKVALLVATQLVGADGQIVREMDGERTAEVKADGSVVISYSTAGPPGSYTLRVAVADATSDKGSVTETPLTLPDYASAGLKLTDPQIFADIEPAAQDSSAQDPLADFLLGNERMVPRFGNVFRKSDSVQFLCMGYNAALDPRVLKPSVAARFEVLKADKPLTASNDILIDTSDFAPTLGPIPLRGAEPGTYQLKVVVTDRVAKKELSTTTTYQIVP